MRIFIKGLAPKWQLSASQLIRLFFTSAELEFASEEAEETDADLSVYVRILAPANESIKAQVTLKDLSNGQTLIREHSGSPDELEDDAIGMKDPVKPIVFVALLQALQDYTGKVQPWGILTGIRPTKLFHRGKLAGQSDDQIRQELERRYMIRKDKLDLMQTIVARQLKALPDLYRLKHEVSIYIGIPFCPTKCAYCTFPAYAIGSARSSVDGFLTGLYYEMEQVGEWLKQNGIGITTIYFGGGTPTSISADQMDQLYTHMRKVFPRLERVREITVEAGRPDTITREKLEVIRRHGIDRISINPQSYIQETLRTIGRHHTVEETVEKFWLAREMGLDNINMDLIIGLPGEGVKEFQYTLQRTAELMPESLTIHTLSFKRASEMTRNKTSYDVADTREVEAMVEMASQWTKVHGYNPYYLYRQKNILGNLENVGYAQPGKESLYNVIIMEEMQTIIGLGSGAASKWVDPESGKITRFANPKDPYSYNATFKKCTEAKIAQLERLYGSLSHMDESLSRVK